MFLLVGTCSFGAAYLVDFLDPSFRTPDELASYLDAPVLAALPKGD
jgi:capsular polysaccharide biosynthesis protein